MFSPSRNTGFQSTLPVWGATVILTPIRLANPYFNPRSPCGERPVQHRFARPRRKISIHAPRVGSDDMLLHAHSGGPYFNPRSPCGERPLGSSVCDNREPFQSTLPVWGATIIQCIGDTEYRFQSTLPVWGATSELASALERIEISIHAPRVGSDLSFMFYSLHFTFQSTLPVWGATYRTVSPWSKSSSHFNPRSPCGERRYRSGKLFLLRGISIHAPRVGSDQGDHGRVSAYDGISIHAPRVGSDGERYGKTDQI